MPPAYFDVHSGGHEDRRSRRDCNAQFTVTVAAANCIVIRNFQCVIWSKLDHNTAATAAPGRSRASAQHELDPYVAAPAIAHDQCPLRWWAANMTSYPLVAKVARHLLAILATSVAREAFLRQVTSSPRIAITLHQQRLIASFS